MKLIITLAICFVAVVFAVDDVQVLRNEQVVNSDNYNYAYELSNGVSVQEAGVLKDPETLSAQGQFSFTAPEGEHFTLTYIADENGFQPQGAHLPTPPPIPEAIQRALAYLATAPPHVERK